MKTANECIDHIIKIGSNIEHSKTTLSNHLLGVYSLLLQAKAPTYLCLAGLFHSVYGTEYFDSESIMTRQEVKNYIGKEAEELVFLFCHLRERDNTILKSENKDLVFLGLMNLLETYTANKDNQNTIDMMTKFQQKYEELISDA